jgi:hypothetical protein
MNKYEKLLDKFEKMSNKKKVEILYDAIDFMNEYNGRSTSDCIVLAMGGGMEAINDNEK